MATLLELTNRVLRRLREDEVTSLADSDYATLVAGFVADIAQEVNHAHAWRALDTQLTFDVVAGQRDYDLGRLVADGGSVIAAADARVTNSHSVPLYGADGLPGAWIGATSTATTLVRMQDIERTYLSTKYFGNRSVTSALPTEYGLRHNSSAGEMFEGILLTLYPTPSASGPLVRIGFNTPEEELDPTTDEATEIFVPNRVVFLGALYLALNERGEEIGEPGNIAETRYLRALASAQEADLSVRDRTGEMDWYRN